MLGHSFGTVVACGLVEQLERCGLKVRGLVALDGRVVPARCCFSDSLPVRLWQWQSTPHFRLPYTQLDCHAPLVPCLI